MEKMIANWSAYISARQLLIDNNMIRTFNNPVEDFSEWLVANCMNGQLAINVNQKDYDVETVDKHIQVKSIAKAPINPNGYIVTPKDRKNQLATHYAFVFFDNYIPADIYIINADWVRDYPKSQIKRQDLTEICGGEIAYIGGVSVRYKEK